MVKKTFIYSYRLEESGTLRRHTPVLLEPSRRRTPHKERNRPPLSPMDQAEGASARDTCQVSNPRQDRNVFEFARSPEPGGIVELSGMQSLSVRPRVRLFSIYILYCRLSLNYLFMCFTIPI